MDDPALPRLPEVLEGFRIGPLRRSAGILAVHAALDRLDLPVEVHAVRADAMPGGPESFLAVLRRAAEVRHEALLPYVTGGRAGDLLFAAAKAVDAPALDEVLSRGGPLAEDRALAIGAAIAGVLAALERAGLRHGDVTTRRILLPGRGQVAIGPPRLVPATAAPRNDRYQSPEEARGAAGDVRSDLFVLGLVLVEALTGRPAAAGPPAEARRMIAENRVRTDLPDVRPTTRAVLARLLSPDPAGRYPTAAAAEAVLRGEPGVEDAPVAAVAVAPVPVAAPPAAAPETAPVPRASPVEGSPRPPVPAAPASAPAVPLTSRTPTPAPESAAAQRAPGRLYLEGRLGETLLEVDETVHVGRPAGAADVAARPDRFPEAEFAIERSPENDVLRPIRAPVTVNGIAVESHVLQHGDAIVGPGVRARYERSVRTALRAADAASGPPPSAGTARAVLAASLVIALVAVGISLPRFTSAREAADVAEERAATAARGLDTARSAAAKPAAPAATPTGASTEQAARDAWEAARDAARRNPDDLAGHRERLAAIVSRFGETGHGAIAKAEIEEIDRRARGAGGSELEKLIADARRVADEGRLEEALRSLRSWIEAHPGTIAAERAAVAAAQIENEIVGRFEADCARIERAIAQKDWTAALRIGSRAMDYAPASGRDRLRDLIRRAETGREGGDPNAPPKRAEGPAAGPPGPRPGTEPPTPPGPGTDEPPPPGGDREKDAEAAFRHGKSLMQSGKDGEAIDALLAFLRDWKDTKAGAKHDVEARGRITALAQGPAGVEKLFRGKVEKAEKGRWRISYDFSDERQLADFRDVEAFEAPPRAKWTVVDGAARAKGSGALVLDATFQIDQIVANVRVSPERAHDLGVAFLDASEPRRFYLYILQNTFFTLGKGAAAKVFEENAIVLFGPGMWRDTPPGQIGFVRKCGSPEPTIRPAETAPLKCGKSEGQVWMRMEGGKQISGSAYGDIKLEFQGIEPGVFVLNSGGTFDDFVVEGTPDPEWVARRWRAILSGL